MGRLHVNGSPTPPGKKFGNTKSSSSWVRTTSQGRGAPPPGKVLHQGDNVFSPMQIRGISKDTEGCQPPGEACDQQPAVISLLLSFLPKIGSSKKICIFLVKQGQSQKLVLWLPREKVHSSLVEEGLSCMEGHNLWAQAGAWRMVIAIPISLLFCLVSCILECHHSSFTGMVKNIFQSQFMDAMK